MPNQYYRTTAFSKHLLDLADGIKKPRIYEGTGYLLDTTYYYNAALPLEIGNNSMNYAVEQIIGLHNKVLLIRISPLPKAEFELPYYGDRFKLEFKYSDIVWQIPDAESHFSEIAPIGVILYHDYEILSADDINAFDQRSSEEQRSKIDLVADKLIKSPRKFASGVII